MSIITVGIYLAKNIFAVHGVDENGKAVLIKPKISREQLLLPTRQESIAPTGRGRKLLIGK